MKALIVDTEAVKNNLDVIKRKAGSAAVYAVVKGDGYGLGVVELARLISAEGITRFAVTEPGEAAALRKAGFTEQEILMLRSTTDHNELEQLMDLNVTLSVGSYESAVAINGIAESRSTIAEAHIEIDTGMGRYGFLPTELDKVISVYKYMSNIAVTGVYTHFHSAFSSEKDTFSQLDGFKDAVERIRQAGYETGVVHAANSSALFRFDETRLDAVRVGSAILGRLSFRGSYGLKKVGFCEASVDELRWLPKKHPVGYGAAYVTKKPTRIAVLPVGYYHGFGVEKGRDIWRWRDCLRGQLSLLKAALTRKALYVKIGEQRARVLGHVGMLHTVVDVTDLSVAIGDVATLDVNPLNAKALEIIYR